MAEKKEGIGVGYGLTRDNFIPDPLIDTDCFCPQRCRYEGYRREPRHRSSDRTCAKASRLGSLRWWKNAYADADNEGAREAHEHLSSPH